MNNTQENKQSSNHASEIVLDTNSEVYRDDENFSADVTDFKGHIAQIQEIAVEQAFTSTGTTKNKAEAGTNLINAVIPVKNALRNVGTYGKNHKLEADVDYPDSTFTKVPDTELATIAGKIHKLAVANAAELLRYKITAPMIAAVNTLRLSYVASIGKPRIDIILRKNATRQLKDLFRQTDTILHRMDKTILVFKPGHPDFVANYFDARIIIDLGKRHTGAKTITVKGKVTHFETEAPVAGATITVVETSQSVVTDAQGNFTITIQVAGDYSFRVEKEEFTTYLESPARLEAGFEYTFDFDLEPVA
jgi:hypothetical protein